MIAFVRRALPALAVTLLVLTGCSDVPTPTAPASDPSAAPGPLFSMGAGGPDLDRLARFDRKPSLTVAWAKKWIGPEGGRLEFIGFAVDVPAGAVDRVTQFSIRLPVDPNGSERVVAEFGPHGATFARPVAIELPYAGTSRVGEEPQIGWWNGATSAWEPFQTTLTTDRLRIRTETTHFSTYGSMEMFGTVPLISGG